MNRDDVGVRKVGSRVAPSTVLVLGALTAVLLVWAVLELGAVLSTGQWAAGGWNPGAVVMTFLQRGTWNGSHWVAAALVVALLAAAVAASLYWLRRRNRGKQRGDGRAKHLGRASSFSRDAVQAHAEAAELSEGGLVGLVLAKVVRTGQDFWVGFRDGLVALAGPGSGKTSALVVTGALDAPGACWVTSNKPDVAALLHSSRDKGRTFVFDPQQIANMDPVIFYDPLSDIRAGLRHRVGANGQLVVLDQRLSRAIELANQFADAGRPADARTDAFFDPASRGLLASFLLAAAVEHLPLIRVLEWTFQSDNKLPRDILRRHGLTTSAKQVEGIQDLHHETKGSVYQGASTILAFMQDASAQPWVQRMGPDDDRQEFDPAAFVRSEDLMICLSREGVGSFGPILAAMTNATIRAAENYAAQCGGRVPTPIVFQLDEVANVCRITSLPDLVSHVGSRGIFIAPYLQSPGQGRSAWGKDGWDKLFGASVVRILARGLIDMDFLGDMSKAIGDQPVMRTTQSTSTTGKFGGSTRSTSEQWTMEPIMPPSELASLPQWRAVVIPAGERAALLELVPWFDRPELADRVNRSKAEFLALRPELAVAVDAAERADQGLPEQQPQAS